MLDKTKDFDENVSLNKSLKLISDDGWELVNVIHTKNVNETNEHEKGTTIDYEQKFNYHFKRKID